MCPRLTWADGCRGFSGFEVIKQPKASPPATLNCTPKGRGDPQPFTLACAGAPRLGGLISLVPCPQQHSSDWGRCGTPRRKFKASGCPTTPPKFPAPTPSTTSSLTSLAAPEGTHICQWCGSCPKNPQAQPRRPWAATLSPEAAWEGRGESQLAQGQKQERGSLELQ